MTRDARSEAYRPILLCRRAHGVESLLQLIDVRVSCQEWYSKNELHKNCAYGPHVDRRRIEAGSPEKLWRPVPPVR